MSDALRREWSELLGQWNVDSALAEEAFADVCRRYAAPGRHYHTLDHIWSMLPIVGSLSSRIPNPNAVKLATWLHDVVYDSRAGDNEQRSAEYAEVLCGRLAIPDSRLVASLILTTKTHDACGEPDAQALIDADLAILGASESDYRKYAEGIRLEYGWVPEAEFRSGRRKILERFLATPTIFHLLHELEAPARRNIAAEIARDGSDTTG